MDKAARSLLIIVGILIVFGLIMLSSAGVVEGQNLFGSPLYFVKHQFLYGVLPGILLFWICSKPPVSFWKKFSLPILLVGLVMMIAVLVPSIGLVIKGARRWIEIGPIVFQPSEFLKLALIIYLSALFGRLNSSHYSHGRTHRSSFKEWSFVLIPFLVIMGFLGLLLVLEPDVKTFVLLSVIGFGIYFFAGAKVSHLLILTLVGVILLGALAFAPYRFNRIKAFLNPNTDTQGISYHANQARIGIGSGGIFGLGFGQSRQKINFLPEPVGDSIFAIIVEELGFIGGMFVLGLFFVFMLVLLQIARGTSDQFARLFVLGSMIWIVSQAFVNIGAITNIIPLTGAPLPFISYGSSSLVAILASLGIVFNIAKQTRPGTR